MTEAAPAENRVFEDAEALARNAAEWLCARALASGVDRALCGSTSPRLNLVDVIGISNINSAGATAIQK